MTQDEQLAQLDAATRSIALVRDAIATSDTDTALALIDRALRDIQTSLDATDQALEQLQVVQDSSISAQQEMRAAKEALQPSEPVPPPVGYTATTSRDATPKPPPPTLGPAGFRFTDPTFGSPLVRVTDEHTGGGCIRVASNSHISAWNCDSTTFYCVNEGGGALFFQLNNGQPQKLEASCGSYIEPAFSYVDPNRIWCAGGANQRTIYTYDLATGDSTVVCDLDQQYPELPLANTYVGCTLTTDADVWVSFFGGTGQDSHRYLHHSKAGLYDFVQATGSHIHAVTLERTGRYVIVCATGPDISAGRAQMTVWDTETGGLTPLTKLPGGHDSCGYGSWVNQDCCTSTRYDGLQWQYRALATPEQTRDVINPPLDPQEIYISDHSSWRNNTGKDHEPFFSFTYRRTPDGTEPAPWRAWDDEIIGVTPDGSGTVYRFAHHQSDASQDFWAQPIGNVAPNGRWAIFTSNWQRTLANQRQDVFLVELR